MGANSLRRKDIATYLCPVHYYNIKTPVWLPRFFPKELIWKMPDEEAVYITFDDGPHETATPLVLDLLKEYDAKATFFCIGKNVAAHPQLFQRIVSEGHLVGNHSHDHLNGWKNTNESYLKNILKASRHIDNKIFRPPYGRIKISQSKRLLQRGWTIYMWDVLSGDFDTSISPEECAENVLQHIEPGSIVVFHDSEKAFLRMKYALPHVLEYCKSKNWEMKTLTTH